MTQAATVARTDDALRAIIEQQAKQLAAMREQLAQVNTPRKLTLKVTAKKADGTGSDGAISVYGLGRFPVTLYAGSWERLLASADEIKAFIVANEAIISRKS